MSNSLEEFVFSMPPVTRALAAGTFVVTLSHTLGLLNVRHLMLDWIAVVQRLQVWRLVTDFFFIGPFSLSWLFHMYFFVQYSAALEQHPCFSRSAAGDGGYLYFVSIQMLLLSTFSLALFFPTGRPAMGISLAFAIIYYWSKKEPMMPISVWGFMIKAWQLPYVMVLLNLMMGQSLYHDFFGLLSGHMYYFVRDIVPVELNVTVIRKAPKVFATITEQLQSLTRRATGAVRRNSSRGSDAPAATASPSRVATLFSSALGSGASGSGSHSGSFPGRGYRLGGDNNSAASNNNNSNGRATS